MSGIDELLAPISGDRPGGRDVSDAVESFQIDQARKGASPGPQDDKSAAEQRADRQDAASKVASLATKALKKDSKDLTIAAWLTEAWLTVDGFEGLANGLELLRRLIEDFWEHLYPEDVEGRAVAVDFVGSELRTAVRFVELTDWGHTFFDYDRARGGAKDRFGGESGAAPVPDDPSAPTAENFDAGFRETGKARYKQLSAHLGRSIDNLSALTAACEERFADADVKPSFGSLSKELARAQAIVSELLAQKLEEDPDPVEPEPATSIDPADPAVSPSPGAPPSTVSRHPTSVSEAVERLVGAASYLRAQDPEDPAPYLAVRGLRWGELRANGSSLDLRLLDAPRTDVRKRLRQSLLDGDWKALLAASEDVMATPSGRGWLDLQRYTVTALQNLGGGYRRVADAILAQLRLLLEDLPDLPTKALMDDTPTANAETLEWLSRVGARDRDEAGGAAGRTGGEEDDPERIRSEASYAKAREWAASGNPQQGVQLLMRRAQHETSARARFITLGHAAAIMVDHGMSSVAQPILEDLVRETNERKLEKWEAGDLVARPIALLYRCLPEDDGTRKELYQQICRLDPVQAWVLDGSDTGSGTRSEESIREGHDERGDGTSLDS